LRPAKDLLVRENHFYNCLEGCVIDLDDADPWTIGRVLLQENIIELPTGGGLSPVGIRLDGDGASARLFKQVVIRNNQIRHLDAAAGAAATIGISLDSTEAAIVEENLINIGSTPNTPDISKAIQRTSSVAIKTFNNQSTNGKFLPSTYGSPMRQDPDMITEAENWLLTA